MLRQTSKGWLAFGSALALLTAVSMAPVATAEDSLDGKLIAAAGPMGSRGGGLPGTPGSMPEAAVPAREVDAAPDAEAPGRISPSTGAEKISVTFEEPEKDIMTKQAMDKLNVIVESLEFANADLRNVIRIIGERLDINFIFDTEDISGKVTLRLHNIRLKDALDTILTSRKLALVPDRSGIFRIVPQERVGRKQVETHTEVMALNWVNAVDVAKTLSPFLSEDVGKMQANEESNSIIITDVPPQIETIKRLLAQIDLPERQVLIEGRLADVNIGALRDLGTKWTLSQNNPFSNYASRTIDDAGKGQVFDPTTGLGSTTIADPLNVANILNKGFGFDGTNGGTLALGDKLGIFGSEFNLNATFNALESRNVVQTLANPRVTTLNNVPANIKIVQRIPYTQAVQGPTQGSTTAEIEFDEAGVDITAKPIITPNGYVRLEIKLEQRINRGPASSASSANPLPPPIIDVRDANTNVIVPDGNTVVLGGLRQINQTQRTDGLPWFHEIPLLGWLFKNKHYDQQKIELILMMTPHIIKESVKLTEHEKFWYDKIDSDWHLPDYFFDDTKSLMDPGEAAKAGYKP